MLEELIEYLNHFDLGDGILFIIVCGWVIVTIYQKIKSVFEEHRARVESDVKDKIELKQLTIDIDDAQKSLSQLKKDMEESTDDLTRMINEAVNTEHEDKERLEQTITDFSRSLSTQNITIIELENRIIKMEKQINLLFQTDKDSIKKQITDSYNKFVKVEKRIDLISLQNLENIYNKYIEENGDGADEFLAKLMTDLRNLPTTKEKNREA